MTTEPDAAHLLGAVADERLLEDGGLLPIAVGRLDPVPASRARGPIVAVGAGLTGLTLLGGIALVVLGLIFAFSHGADLIDGGLVAAGLLLAGTHWGWVHVAEAIATATQARAAREVEARGRQWLSAIAPFPRHEVLTEVEDDGAIVILRVLYRPVSTRPGRFSFAREVEGRERHDAHEPAAMVTERAEALRRAAALATERERQRFLAAADRYETEQLRSDDERAAQEAQRAASRALSEQINANLRSPPLEG